MGAPLRAVPPLAPGDRLGRAEFERRWESMPGLEKAELIDGIVYLPGPVSFGHADAHATLAGWLWTYRAHAGGRLVDNATVRLDEENDPQPDLALLVEGGAARVDEEGFVEGAPALIVEVALSSRAYDLHQKKEVYRRHGVGTYLVWQVEDQRLRWFELVDGDYQERGPDADGIFRSARFPDLWLDVDALRRDDSAAVLDALQRGLRTGA